ncbi:MAG: branched-chain amino acid ABC transporter permease [Alphaproteobacteria bacterium]|nr:branched-chain amino acid ABC transporter permease [Alphaproteobacteria bacterium]
MLDPLILLPAVINGLTMGAVYALVALGLTLIYGVLHIINFAHGSLLMVGLYGVFFLHRAGVDPYLALVIMVPALFVVGYALQWSVIGKASHGSDQNVLLVTLGVSIVIENLALYFFTADTLTVDTPYVFEMIDLGIALVPLPRVIAFLSALVLAALLWLLIARSDLGRAIRAVAKERQGARLVGIDVDHIFAMSFGIGTACLGAAACLLLPMFYVSPHVGHVFVLVAFTVVVLGGMGSFSGALFGGLLIGVTESVGGLLLGESLGQIGIFLIFIATLMFRPSGLFGARLS